MLLWCLLWLFWVSVEPPAAGTGGGPSVTSLFIAWRSVSSSTCLRLWFSKLSPRDLDLDSLMTMLSEDVASEEYLRERFDWL